MEPDDFALSDTHIDLGHSTKESHFFKNYQAFISRFQFKAAFINQDETWPTHSDSTEEILYPTTNIPKHSETLSDVGCEVVSELIDADGDLILHRRKREQYGVIYIEHTLATHLSDVGLQVWPACLLLCDHIIDNAEMFDNAVVIELGAGVGMASVVAAMFAQRVLCTDVGKEVLSACVRNADTNRHLYKYCNRNTKRQDVVKVRQLDWTSKPQTAEGITDSNNEYQWTPDDFNDLHAAHIFLAADVIYSDDLTDALFVTILDIMGKPPVGKSLFFSLEKRLNFTLADRDIACPAYDYYCQCLGKLQSLELESGIKFEVCQLSTDFPKYFEYNRTKYLELWKISTT